MADRIGQLRKRIIGIQEKLKSASEDTSLALLELDMAEDYAEWRGELQERTLAYVVGLDTALAELHRERQKLLEEQIASAHA